jgi:hypothetical protein
MKQKKSDKKLSLNKQTVADLTVDDLRGVRGGADSSKECLLFDDLTDVSLGICSEETLC